MVGYSWTCSRTEVDQRKDGVDVVKDTAGDWVRTSTRDAYEIVRDEARMEVRWDRR